MSTAGNPQAPYDHQAQAAPTAYPQAQRPTADKAVVRQILFGGGVVLGIAVASSLLSTIGNAVYGFRGEQIFGLVWSIFIALVFVAGAGLSALYIAPFARATSATDLIKRLAIAASVGAAALLVLNFIWSVISGGQYLVQMIISSGIFGSITTGLTYGAFFALGVFIARALPAAPRRQPHTGQPQGYAPQQPAQQPGYPASGYVQPQAPAQAPAYVQPQAPTQPAGYVQPQAPGYAQPPAQPQQPLPPQG